MITPRVRFGPRLKEFLPYFVIESEAIAYIPPLRSYFYATLIARGRYKEAAQHMFDLADSLNGLHDPENVRDGTMLSRRTRALLASMGALQLVPDDQAILRRQRKDSMKRCVPIVMKEPSLRFSCSKLSRDLAF